MTLQVACETVNPLIPIFVLAAAAIAGCAAPKSNTTSTSRGNDDAIRVAKLDLSLPAETVAENSMMSAREDFLWESILYGKERERPSDRIGLENWKQRLPELRDVMVTQARARNLDCESLGKSIDAALASPRNEGLAVVPIAAYQISADGGSAWVIVCAWEFDMPEPGTMKVGLGHRRVFVYDVQTLRLLAYTTCN